MLNYIIRRLLGIIPLLFGITVISFIIIHLAPGKPTTQQELMSPRISYEAKVRMERLLDLDKPLHIRYIKWLGRIVSFDLGVSRIYDRPVVEKILERIPVTLTINILALCFILIISIPLGIIAASKPGSCFDKITTVGVFIGFALPTFWVALLLMQFFSLKLGYFPISGIKSLDFEYFSWPKKILDLAHHLILPVCVSSIGSLAGFSRYIRQNMLQALSQPYIITAKAKGLSQRQILYCHAFPNAVLPLVTILGLSIPGLLGGSVIFESIFALPGIGELYYKAVMARDTDLIMALVILGAILTMIGNLVADIAYAYVDPRIRYRK
ncbi:MAG: ABC transporter permease [Candidatus Omnitrophota bacterium]